jgi:hypothetical protein
VLTMKREILDMPENDDATGAALGKYLKRKISFVVRPFFSYTLVWFRP